MNSPADPIFAACARPAPVATDPASAGARAQMEGPRRRYQGPASPVLKACGEPRLPGGPGSPELPSWPRRPKRASFPEPPPAPPAPALARGAGGVKAAGAGAPASPFPPDSFDLRALGGAYAPGQPGSARGDPGNGPQLISFHPTAWGRLETAEPVIAFFRRPSADWTTANQRLVYTP